MEDGGFAVIWTATAAAGPTGFWIVWRHKDNQDALADVYVRAIDRNGNFLTGEIMMNTFVGESASWPYVGSGEAATVGVWNYLYPSAGRQGTYAWIIPDLS